MKVIWKYSKEGSNNKKKSLIIRGVIKYNKIYEIINVEMIFEIKTTK